MFNSNSECADSHKRHQQELEKSLSRVECSDEVVIVPYEPILNKRINNTHFSFDSFIRSSENFENKAARNPIRIKSEIGANHTVYGNLQLSKVQ
jgi:hypothetical protein